MGYADTLIRGLRLSDAMEQIDRCANLTDLLPLAAPFAGVGRVVVLLLMGRVQESDDWRARVEPMLAELGAWWGMLWLWDTRAWRFLSEGRFAEACELYERIEATAARAGIGEPCLVPWAGHALAAYAGSGREADALRVLAGLDDAATRLPCRWPRIAAAVGRARLAESAGKNEEADGFFDMALDLHTEVDLPLERLQTLLEYGKFLRRAGHLERSRRILAKAVELGETTGTGWLAGQAREELRVAGGRRRRRREDPTNLTPQEQRVAALAATGATNQEIANKLFLAVSTIETHLERIYTKLGIHSRRELILRRRSVDGE
jgi:DNA-binding CsgD family transcriptional regulator